MKTIREMMNMSGRTVCITGATGWIGSVIAETLAELNANIILVDKPNSDFERVVKNINQVTGVNVYSLECDLESQKERNNLQINIEKITDNISVLINNAAFVGESDLVGWGVPFEEQTIDTWRRAFEVNLTSVFDLCRKFTPLLNNAIGANIINMSSIYGTCGPDWSLYEDTPMSNPAAYSASKGGLIQFSRWLSTTIAPSIRVNVISPGGVYRGQPDLFVKRYEKRTPLKRMANEEDFKGVIAYLSSDLSKYVTGQNIFVDGGWTVW